MRPFDLPQTSLSRQQFTLHRENHLESHPFEEQRPAEKAWCFSIVLPDVAVSLLEKLLICV